MAAVADSRTEPEASVPATAKAVAALELRGVGKSFGVGRGRTEVLANINLTVSEGEFVAVVGYSGAGKTTLVNMVAGLETPDAGTVAIAGKPIVGPGPDRGVVFQNYSLLPWLTAYENVLLAVDAVFSTWTPEQKRVHAEKYLALVNLSKARDKRPSELSGGMRQRVSVARALATEPKVLLMDEPLGALDALTRATLQDEIGKIWQATKKTVLLITNDVDEALMLADRIVPLSHGPSATLGPDIDVDIPRPRDRKAMNHDERWKRARNRVIEYLLGPGARKGLRPAPGARARAALALSPSPSRPAHEAA
jgi:nitrate/nitrite transport system ATP-binding protein